MPTHAIRILGIYEDALTTSHAGDSITSLVLRLSSRPSEEWKSAFHLEWGMTSYLRKRNVQVGTVRVHGSSDVREGLVVHASPEDYVAIHRAHVELAVERANARVDHTDRLQNVTVSHAARTIRQINQEFYAAERPAPADRPATGRTEGAHDPAADAWRSTGR